MGHSLKAQKTHMTRINRDLGLAFPLPHKRLSDPREVRETFLEIMAAYCKLREKSVMWVGEKTPAHSGYVHEIARLFPEAKYLWIFRDGRDVALSMSKVPWLSVDIGVNFLIWLFYYRYQLIAKRLGIKILFVRYESLVNDPFCEMRRICDFLDVDFEPETAAGSGNLDGVLPWENSWKWLAGCPITNSRIGTWRRCLGREDIEFLEWLGGTALAEMGYDVVSSTRWWSHIHRLARVGFQAARFLWRSPFEDTVSQLSRLRVTRLEEHNG